MSAEPEENSLLYEIIDTPVNTGVMFRTSVDEGSYIPTHWHRAVEIIYLLEGELEISIDSKVTYLKAGECQLINANVMHATKCTRPNKAILLQIPVDFMERYIPNVQQILFVWNPHTSDPVKQTKLEILKTVLHQMQIVNDIRPEGFILRFNSLLFELLFQLYHSFSIKITQKDTRQRTKDLDRLNKVLNYTAQNYSNPITLDEIAEIACLQTRYFCKFFKKCMGVTFLEYQNELRLSHIYRDLITTDDAIHSILERHGFTNYKLFRRVFQEHFKGTPSDIRKRQKKT